MPSSFIENILFSVTLFLFTMGTLVELRANCERRNIYKPVILLGSWRSGVQASGGWGGWGMESLQDPISTNGRMQ
jgi:hypothetical protein